MSDENTSVENNSAGSDSGGEQNSSLSSAAANFYDNSNNNDDASSEGDNNNAAADTPNTNDEASKQNNESDPNSEGEDGDSNEGEGSEEDGEKPVDYAELKLPEELPEGMDVDEDLFKGVKEIGLKHKIPPEAMQELIDTYAQRVKDSDVNLQNQWAEVEKGWKESAKNDSEIGGDKFDTNVEKAKRAINKFGTDELREALEQSRMGNHPEVIRVFARIGEKITEESNFDRGSNSGQRSRSDVLFDNKSN